LHIDWIAHAAEPTPLWVFKTRFGKLLQTNSVVLKETSAWIEYYYRSVLPGVHFIPFSKDNITQVGETFCPTVNTYKHRRELEYTDLLFL
jgi:hypothetical protein